MNKVSTVNRRGFLKKSLYSAPVVLGLGHLSPTMVHGADGSGGFTVQQPSSQVEGDANQVTAAGQAVGNNATSQQTGTNGSAIGGNGTTVVVEESSAATSDDNNQTK